MKAPQPIRMIEACCAFKGARLVSSPKREAGPRWFVHEEDRDWFEAERLRNSVRDALAARLGIDPAALDDNIRLVLRIAELDERTRQARRRSEQAARIRRVVARIREVAA